MIKLISESFLQVESMTLLIFCLFTTLLVFIILCIYPSRKIKMTKNIPGPPTLPFIGNAHMLEVGGNAFYEQILGYCKYYGSMFKIVLAYQPFIIFLRADEVECLLQSSTNITKSQDYDFLKPWLGTGLLTSTGKKWHTRRKMLTPSFHFNILNEFLDVFNEQSETMVQKLQMHADTQKSFDIFNFITLCALDIICESAMGCDVRAQTDIDSTYAATVSEISHLIHVRQKTPWYWPDWVYNLLKQGKSQKRCLKVLHDFTEQVIKERSELYHQSAVDLGTNEAFYLGQKKRMAFLDLLLHQQAMNKELTDSDIREEVDTFMFEGHDTTAAAANWAIHLIGANPLVQEKLHKEMDEIFGDSNRHATMADIKEMKYLDCVIKETLRLFPSVPMFGRKLDVDTVINGHCIPRGATCVVVTVALHRDPQVFPDPETFQPDRFLPENCSSRHPFSYVPFSAGPRNCIGQKFAMNEEKVILSSILRKYKIESTQNREELQPKGEIILRPETGIWVKLHLLN